MNTATKSFQNWSYKKQPHGFSSMGFVRDWELLQRRERFIPILSDIVEEANLLVIYGVRLPKIVEGR